MPKVMADEIQLGQLFQNLIDNALKFRPPDRPPRVTISVRREGGRAVFSVADNGIGIEEEYREKIFRVFQRLHHREDYEGSGVGLLSGSILGGCGTLGGECQRIRGLCQNKTQRDKGRVF